MEMLNSVLLLRFWQQISCKEYQLCITNHTQTNGMHHAAASTWTHLPSTFTVMGFQDYVTARTHGLPCGGGDRDKHAQS